MLHRPALLAFVATALLCELLGEVPPFSRFEMYAGLASERRSSAVLQFRVGGEPVLPWSLTRFTGDGLFELPLPELAPSTMRWYRDEARTFVRAHPGEGAAPGPVAVTWGYVVVGWRDDRVEELEPFVTLAEGHAWRE